MSEKKSEKRAKYRAFLKLDLDTIPPQFDNIDI